MSRGGADVAMRIGIVGAGIAGLSVAHAIRARDPRAEIVVWESSDRCGGRIGTTHDAGYTIEWAANALLSSATHARALAGRLGLDADVIPADARAARRYIYRHGTLHAFPIGPASLFRCAALSPLARARVALEPVLARRVAHEETIHEYAARHIGDEAAQVLLGAAARGIFAGDSTRLSLDAAFPLMRELERVYRSLIVAQARLARQARERGPLWSLRGGIGSLVDALGQSLSDAIELGRAVSRISRTERGARLTFADARTEDVDALVLAVPARNAARLLREHDARAAATLEGIVCAGVAVVAIAARADAFARPMDGYGFLTAPGEPLPVLGVLADSVVFPARAPEGHTLLRVMIGGTPDPAHAGESDDALRQRAVGVVRDVVGLRGDPEHVWLFRHVDAIPQYTLGHASRIADVRARVGSALPRVHLAGNAFDGVSVGSIVETAERVAEAVRSHAR